MWLKCLKWQVIQTKSVDGLSVSGNCNYWISFLLTITADGDKRSPLDYPILAICREPCTAKDIARIILILRY